VVPVLAGLMAGWMLGRGAGLTDARHGPAAAQARAVTSAAPGAGQIPGSREAGTALGASAREDAVAKTLRDQYERFRVIDQTYALVARSVSPSVVHVVARKMGRRDNGQAARFEETGSGVIVRDEAAGPGCFVLTNNHLVEGAPTRDISVFLHDGRVVRPARLWTDPKADIAVLKVERDDLPAARLGDSDEAEVGTWVLALGSPFGLTQSVSQGIISARDRYEQELELDGVEHQEFLQTDAAINPGNSGGPLVNMKGEVIGINTAIASNGGESVGVGFSIPVNLAKWSMRQLVTSGRVIRGAIGVNLEGITPQEARVAGLESPRGARVIAVQEDSPAAKAGLQVGDIVLKYNGVKVQDFNHLINLVSMTPIGRLAELEVWREQQPKLVNVEVADRDAILARNAAAAGPAAANRDGGSRERDERRGNRALDAITITNEEDARAYELPMEVRGVLVLRIDPASPLATILQPGDVVELVGKDGKPPRDLGEIENAVRAAGGKPLELRIRRLKPEGYVPATLRLEPPK
jgi:serine protease Do